MNTRILSGLGLAALVASAPAFSAPLICRDFIRPIGGSLSFGSPSGSADKVRACIERLPLYQQLVRLLTDGAPRGCDGLQGLTMKFDREKSGDALKWHRFEGTVRCRIATRDQVLDPKAKTPPGGIHTHPANVTIRLAVEGGIHGNEDDGWVLGNYDLKSFEIRSVVVPETTER